MVNHHVCIGRPLSAVSFIEMLSHFLRSAATTRHRHAPARPALRSKLGLLFSSHQHYHPLPPSHSYRANSACISSVEHAQHHFTVPSQLLGTPVRVLEAALPNLSEAAVPSLFEAAVLSSTESAMAGEFFFSLGFKAHAPLRRSS